MSVSLSEGYITISQLVGSKVVLRCNLSLSTFEQLTWKMNGVNLYSFRPKTTLHVNEEAVRLNINMSLSESEQYALVMDQVQMSHAGNYTCEVTTLHAPWEHTWELIVTNVTGVLIRPKLQETQSHTKKLKHTHPSVLKTQTQKVGQQWLHCY